MTFAGMVEESHLVYLPSLTDLTYESLNLKNWMCELGTSSQIRSPIITYAQYYIQICA